MRSAQQLFAMLRDFDALGMKLIWIEYPPATGEWDSVRDRLGRGESGDQRLAKAPKKLQSYTLPYFLQTKNRCNDQTKYAVSNRIFCSALES